MPGILLPRGARVLAQSLPPHDISVRFGLRRAVLGHQSRHNRLRQAVRRFYYLVKIGGFSLRGKLKLEGGVFEKPCFLDERWNGCQAIARRSLQRGQRATGLAAAGGGTCAKARHRAAVRGAFLRGKA